MELFCKTVKKKRKNTVFAIEVWNLKKCYTARNNFDIYFNASGRSSKATAAKYSFLLPS